MRTSRCRCDVEHGRANKRFKTTRSILLRYIRYNSFGPKKRCRPSNSGGEGERVSTPPPRKPVSVTFRHATRVQGGTSLRVAKNPRTMMKTDFTRSFSLLPVGANLVRRNAPANLLKRVGLSRWPIQTASTPPSSSSPVGTSIAWRFYPKIIETRT